MPSKAPDQQQWTLRFKQHKTTILLFVSQTQSFASIKSELLEAIRATGLSQINNHPLPSNPENVILGVPVDKNDISKGWIGLDIPEFDDEGENAAGKKRVGKKDSVLNGSPLGAGLRDGAMLAFRFRDGEDEEMKEDEVDMEDEKWDVVIPTFEDDDESQDME